MKKVLMSLLVLVGICSIASAFTEITAVKLSTATVQGYLVGQSTVNINTKYLTKDFILYNYSGVQDVFFGFTQEVSTWVKVNGRETKMPLKTDASFRFEKFYGDIWLINGGLDKSSSTVYALPIKDK